MDNCTHENSAWAQGLKVCTDCGLVLPGVQYVFSYNDMHSYKRIPVYSRLKRFRTFLRILNHPSVNMNFQHILDCFAKLEFHYMIFPPSERQYFFNKNVTLLYILKHLDLSNKGIPSLKDSSRVTVQWKMMDKIIENSYLHSK